MTLTAVVGSSGSGKTTFLNDVHTSHKCVYIRQYHNIRPYVRIAQIPNFDPTTLPYWHIYQKEEKADSIKAGGTMAGEFTAGLSGGQRKLLLFELIYQRTINQKNLLIVLDEPFAGVTDDFIPWITERLDSLRKKHNLLLVTNDHVEVITSMADNTITVSAIDRSNVKVNTKEKVDRQKSIMALSVGDEFVYNSTMADLRFFYDVEVRFNSGLIGVALFTAFCFGLFLAAFWDSEESSAALVFVAGGIIGFFAINPYLLSLVDWRNYMSEEAEALLHSSKSMNKFLKTLLVLFVILLISAVQFACVIAVVEGFNTFEFFLGVAVDSASMTFAFICFGLFSSFPHQLAETLASMPFLFMLLLSTTFSPGAGVAGLKELRYLFSRFYLWCMLPVVQDTMEGCPADEALNLVYMTLSGFLIVVVFLFVVGVRTIIESMRKKKRSSELEKLQDDDEFMDLQLELYGEKALRRLQHMDSRTSFSVVSVPASEDTDSHDGEEFYA